MDIEKQSKYGKNRSDEGRGKGKKALKVIGKIFAGLVALFIVLYIVLNIVFGIQLNNTIAELKRQGRPMTADEIIPPPVPDEENAAILYNKAFILMTSGEGGTPYIPNKEMGAKNNMIKAIEEVKSLSDISQWTDEQRREIPKLIYSQELQNIYELIEEGSKRPKCNFNLPYEEGPAMLMPHFTPMRSAMRLLCVKALIEAETGKNAQAFDTLLIGLKISNHVKDEPVLISQLVRIACDGIIIKCIEGISDSKGIPVEKANLIIEELSLHRGIEPFIKCMDGERVLCGMWAFEKIIRAKPRELKGFILSDPQPTPAFSLAILSIIGKPIIKKDFAWYLAVMSEMQDSYNIPYYEYVKNKISEDIPKYCIFTRILMPALDRVREVAARYQADIDICRTGLALKVYKAKTGNYPETLGFLSEVPIDPFSGKELVYSSYIGGFKLYSFGPNMTDDGGIPRRYEEGVSRKDYDLVWESQIHLKRSK